MEILQNAAENGYVPHCVHGGRRGYHGEAFNINADVAAARIAAALGAMKLILMTDVRGLLRDKDDEGTLIPVVNVSDVSRLKKEGIISGGMIPKIDCCVDAVRRGVGRAHIIDGRMPPLHFGGALHRRRRGHHVLLSSPRARDRAGQAAPLAYGKGGVRPTETYGG